MRLTFSVIAAACLVACSNSGQLAPSSNDGGSGGGGGGAGSGGGGGGGGSGRGGGGGAVAVDSGVDSGPVIGLGDAGAPLGSYSLKFGPITVAPGVENTQCIVVPLGNASQIRVNQIHNELSQGSHHMIVYRVNDTTPQPTPFDCKPFTDTLDPTKGSTIMITQKHDDVLQLPPGVAYTLNANQMIRLELHYINPGATPITVEATTTMVPIDPALYKYEADFLFIGDPDISIPAHSSQTLGPIFFQLPPEYDGVNFFALTGHEHQYGTNVRISTATSATDPGTSVYDVPGWLWSEPTTVQSNPPFQVAAGGGFNFTCDWNNTSANSVAFGESANNEMCFFWAYYYPSQGGAKVCLHTAQVPGGISVCCPGNAECSQISAFLGQ